jgi:hypothetical protein
MDPPGLDPSLDQEWIAMDYNPTLGDALMVWQDKGHATDLGLVGVWGRVWTGLLFADGFESGNTSEWSAVVP